MKIDIVEEWNRQKKQTEADFLAISGNPDIFNPRRNRGLKWTLQ